MLRNVSNLLIHSKINTKQIQSGEHAKDMFMLKCAKYACIRVALNVRSVFVCADTDYISMEEEQKVEQMLTFLTEESKQAAASTAVSPTTTTSVSSQPFAMSRVKS